MEGIEVKQEKERLIIEENTIYELDMDCVRRKQAEREKRKNVIQPCDSGEAPQDETD